MTPARSSDPARAVPVPGELCGPALGSRISLLWVQGVKCGSTLCIHVLNAEAEACSDLLQESKTIPRTKLWSVSEEQAVLAVLRACSSLTTLLHFPKGARVLGSLVPLLLSWVCTGLAAAASCAFSAAQPSVVMDTGLDPSPAG